MQYCFWEKSGPADFQSIYCVIALFHALEDLLNCTNGVYVNMVVSKLYMTLIKKSSFCVFNVLSITTLCMLKSFGTLTYFCGVCRISVVLDSFDLKPVYSLVL